MKRWLFIFIFMSVFFFTAIAFIASEVTFPLIHSTGITLNQKYYDYAGISHAHSSASTGSGSFEEITRAANKAGCKFIVFTDLNPTNLSSEAKGYSDDVLAIWGAEYSYLGGHILAYGLPESNTLVGLGQTQLFFNDLLHQKTRKPDRGFVIAAHPFLPEHSWESLQDPGLTGMEVLNLEEIWRTAVSKGVLSVVWSFIIFPFNHDLAYLRLFHEPSRELHAWDEVLSKRSFVGIGGSDSTANAFLIPDVPFKFPSYERTFRLMKNHILLRSELTGSYSTDREKILRALNHGNFYFSVDLIGDPTGFVFTARKDKKEFLPGETVSQSHATTTFIVDLGRDLNIGHEIVLTRNGVQVANSNGRALTYRTTDEGAYRVTVRVIPTLPIPDGKTWFTWIFSNAIRIE
jgi:hypothetical protein